MHRPVDVTQVNPLQVIDIISKNDRSYALIDVRSEGEFAQGSLPGFTNAPILNDLERHQVGLMYRHQGPEAAMALGHQLVDPDRENRVAGWLKAIEQSQIHEALVLCWRGGLRSQIACQWILNTGSRVSQIEGGYKGIRKILLSTLAQKQNLWVLSGMTGSGKTQLIHDLNGGAADLEGLSKHRGSAFGAHFGQAQPSQSSFENSLALACINYFKFTIENSLRPLIVEDESRTIGKISLPEHFYHSMLKAPIIEIVEPLAARCERIYHEYVLKPLTDGFPQPKLQQLLLTQLSSLSRHLDRWAPVIRESINDAFRFDPEFAKHQPWIEPLLINYYDVRYSYAQKRLQRRQIFSGTRQEVLAWLKQAKIVDGLPE